jgi:hypothetical protein
MKITIESTGEILAVNGVPARVWQGKTDTGIPLVALIVTIGVDREEDCEQFDRELLEHAPPRPDLEEIFPARNLRR